MRYYEIIAETGAADAIKPAAPSKTKGRYQTPPIKRARHQSGYDDRWQTPSTTTRPPKSSSGP